MRVLITGATSGIGETFLEKFISRGDEVIAVGRNLKKLNELKVKSTGLNINMTIDLNTIINNINSKNK